MPSTTPNEPTPTGETNSAKQRSDRPYQLCVVFGADPADYAEVADTVVSVDDKAGVIQGLIDAGVEVEDFRSRVVVVLDGDPVATTVAYAYLIGFAGRHLDAATADGVAQLDRLVTAAARLAPKERPEARPQHSHVSLNGNPVPQTADHVVFVADSRSPLAGVTNDDISKMRWARTVTADVADTAAEALLVATAVAGLTGRRTDRLPTLVRGDDKIVLEDARSVGEDTRRGRRSRHEAPLVERIEPDTRNLRLQQAAAVAPEEVLSLLGCPSEDSLWSCTRPLSHNHGDATPSMRVVDNKVRCFVDDAEWIDSLRLVALTCGVTADDAADLILGDPAGFEPHAARIAAERASKQP